jgi:tRNA A37 threonylcarbamoyladenosine dehydratase
MRILQPAEGLSKGSWAVCEPKPGIHGVHLDCCYRYGSVSFVTATFGFMAAARAVNKALKNRLK